MFVGSEIVMNGFQEKTGYTLLHLIDIECMDTNCSKTFQRLIQREFIIFSLFPRIACNIITLYIENLTRHMT
jgi:hypothetical protein